MNMRTGGDDACPAFQERDNFAFTSCSNRGHGDDGFSAFRKRCSTHKIHLATYSGIHFGSYRVSAYLTTQVNFQSTIDGGDFWILPDNMHFIYVTNVQHFNNRVIMNKTV